MRLRSPIITPDLTPAQAAAALALAARDPGPASPLSEQARLVLRRAGSGNAADLEPNLHHILLYAESPDSEPPAAESPAAESPDSEPPAAEAADAVETPDATETPPPLVGYAQLTVDADGAAAAELFVDPDHRRRGVGTALLRTVLDRAPAVRCWAHGDSAAAQGLARALGLTAVRELWQMSRPLGEVGPGLPDAVLPPGFSARTFEPGRDEQAWLDVNARAFASHAEQGRMTRADLDDRMGESWFDPAGFILVDDVRHQSANGAAQLAAFHWTKVEGAQGRGEVYVVGVDPAYQGMGLGTSVTLLGLAHLAALGLREATLYVDGDNGAAVATYTRLGFERSAVDVMYAVVNGTSAPTAHPPVAR